MLTELEEKVQEEAEALLEWHLYSEVLEIIVYEKLRAWEGKSLEGMRYWLQVERAAFRILRQSGHFNKRPD